MERGYSRVCPCGASFNTPVFRRVYCDSCKFVGNQARLARRVNHTLSFVGVDGEGVDRPDGSHEYVMLSVGDQTLYRDGSRLALSDILSFLWQCYQERNDACFVGFFLGYDFSQWLRELPVETAHSLLTPRGIAERTSQVKSRNNPVPDPVVWEGWEFDLMAGRRFKLRPHVHHRSVFADGCRNRTCHFSFPDSPLGDVARDSGRAASSGWLYICDTGSFWQTSFLRVIDPKNWDGNPVCTEDEYATVLRGKEGRGMVVPYGDTSYAAAMTEYNTLENTLLARATKRLNEGFMNDDIPIRIKRHEWFGPGRAAQLWMDMLHERHADPAVRKRNRRRGQANGSGVSAASSAGASAQFGDASAARENEQGLLNADVYMSVPAWFTSAARDSYYGGWFEIAMHGHIGASWEYDVNSAYPFIISSLPCLHVQGVHNGRYDRGRGSGYPRDPGRYTLVYGTFTGSDPYFGCLPYRTRTGNILRPRRVKGWYWLHEVWASRRAGLVDEIQVEAWVSYMPCDCSPPLNPSDIGIERMYNLRLQVGKDTPQGKAFKLVYNSAYGKTAQSVGSPKYANPVYASLITAGCRTLILDSIASHPMGSSGVAMVATDGVYFLERHPVLPVSGRDLGAWGETYRSGMTLLMPGVYWDDTAREAIRGGNIPKLKSRGVATRDLATEIARIDDKYSTFHSDLRSGIPGDGWPQIEFPVRMQIVSPKLALHRGAWDTAGQIIHDAPRRISSNPESKRSPQPYIDSNLGVIRTSPYDQWRSLETTPYVKSFGYRDPMREDGLIVDEDGRDPLASFRDWIHEL